MNIRPTGAGHVAVCEKCQAVMRHRNPARVAVWWQTHEEKHERKAG